MAKGVISVEIDASTKKASSKIKQLQNELHGSKAIGEIGTSLKDVGLGEIGGGFGALSKLGTALAGPVGAVAAVGAIVKGFGDLAERGQEAAQTAEVLGVKLTTLNRNFGGTGAGIKEITRDLQLMSANGVNSMEDITSAMQTLTVATKGDVAQAGELVKSFDDIAAGTGMTVSGLAEMTAKIMENGVEQRDLNKLARQGIPIYDALGSAMGITADEAKAAAAEGKVGIEEWNKAVKELGKNYEGLSAAMSSQTLEGARSTYSAMRSMEMLPVAEARNLVIRDGLNNLSEQIQKELDDPIRIGQLKATGELAGEIDFAVERLTEIFTDLPGNIAAALTSLTVSDDEAARKYLAVEIGSAFEKSQKALESGKAGDISAQIKANENYVKQLEKLLKSSDIDEKTKIDVTNSINNFRELNSILKENYEILRKTEEADAELYKRNDEARQAELARIEQIKKNQEEISKMNLAEAKSTGDPKKMLEAFFGGLVMSVEDYLNTIPLLKEQLLAGTAPEGAMERYKFLLDVQEAYNKQLEKEADAKKRAAEESAKFEQDLEKQRLEGKAGIGRDITKEQENLNSITAQLQQLQNARSIVRGDEAHGIFREKWGNLNVSEMGSKEAELILEQQQSNQKLQELKEAYDKYDQKWATARQKTEAMADKITQGVVRVKGTALTS